MPETFFRRFNSLHPHFNPYVKVAFTAETFFWTTWSTVFPLLSVFIVANIANATVQTVTIGYSLHVLARILGDFFASKLSNLPQKRLLFFILVGNIIVNFSYLGFLLVKDPNSIFLVYMVAGIGLGISSPLRATLFSKNIDHEKEARDWADLEIFILAGIAAGTASAGLIITKFGFEWFFIIAFIFGLFSTLPYIYYLSRVDKATQI